MDDNEHNIRTPDTFRTDRLIYPSPYEEEEEQFQMMIEKSKQEYLDELNKKRSQHAFAISRLRLIANTPNDDQKHIQHLIKCCDFLLKKDDKKPSRAPRNFSSFLETMKQSNVFKDLIVFYEENY
jgi:hypothetical protein